VKTEREGICSQVSCAGGREGVVGFGVDTRRWEEEKNEKKSLKFGTSGGRDAELRKSVHCIRARHHTTQLCPLVHYSPIACEVSQIVKTLRVMYVQVAAFSRSSSRNILYCRSVAGRPAA
jgi:hypothetical protein